ncbi:MAG: DUF4783 domain-containing protein [Microscillaceae bacterium]|nr:DUF4783 domain-containing protein [Microscillaceae bacterium]
MNTKLLLTGLLIITISALAFGQDEVLNKFAADMQSGNTQDLLSFLNDQVEISIDGQSNSLSKGESVNLIKGFLSKHPVSAFQYKHKGSSGNTGYAIASMVSNGQNYRIMIRMKDNTIEKIEFKPE